MCCLRYGEPHACGAIHAKLARLLCCSPSLSSFEPHFLRPWKRLNLATYSFASPQSSLWPPTPSLVALAFGGGRKSTFRRASIVHPLDFTKFRANWLILLRLRVNRYPRNLR